MTDIFFELEVIKLLFASSKFELELTSGPCSWVLDTNSTAVLLNINSENNLGYPQEFGDLLTKHEYAWSEAQSSRSARSVTYSTANPVGTPL